MNLELILSNEFENILLILLIRKNVNPNKADKINKRLIKLIDVLLLRKSIVIKGNKNEKIKIKGLTNDLILNTAFHLEEDEFIALGNEKLQIINLNDFSIETYETSNEGFNSILDGNIDNLKIIKRQNLTSKELWISLNNGISILNLDTKEFNNFKFNPRSKNKFPQGFSSAIISNKNEVWLTNSSTGLYKYDENNLDEINHYIFDINDKKSITSSSLTCTSLI